MTRQPLFGSQPDRIMPPPSGCTSAVAAPRAHDVAGLEARLREASALRAPALVHVAVGKMPSARGMVLMPPVRGAVRPPMP